MFPRLHVAKLATRRIDLARHLVGVGVRVKVRVRAGVRARVRVRASFTWSPTEMLLLRLAWPSLAIAST